MPFYLFILFSIEHFSLQLANKINYTRCKKKLCKWNNRKPKTVRISGSSDRRHFIRWIWMQQWSRSCTLWITLSLLLRCWYLWQLGRGMPGQQLDSKQQVPVSFTLQSSPLCSNLVSADSRKGCSFKKKCADLFSVGFIGFAFAFLSKLCRSFYIVETENIFGVLSEL